MIGRKCCGFIVLWLSNEVTWNYWNNFDGNNNNHFDDDICLRWFWWLLNCLKTKLGQKTKIFFFFGGGAMIVLIEIIFSCSSIWGWNRFHFSATQNCLKRKSLMLMLIRCCFSFIILESKYHFHFLRWLLKTAGRENWVRLTNLLKGSQLPGGPKTW